MTDFLLCDSHELKPLSDVAGEQVARWARVPVHGMTSSRRHRSQLPGRGRVHGPASSAPAWAPPRPHRAWSQQGAWWNLGLDSAPVGGPGSWGHSGLALSSGTGVCQSPNAGRGLQGPGAAQAKHPRAEERHIVSSKSPRRKPWGSQSPKGPTLGDSSQARVGQDISLRMPPGPREPVTQRILVC